MRSSLLGDSYFWRRARDSMGYAHRLLRKHPIVFGFAEGVRIPFQLFKQKIKTTCLGGSYFWRRARDSMGSAHRLLRKHPIVFGFAEGVRIPFQLFKQKIKTTCLGGSYFWRRARDSNPRNGFGRLHDFQSCSFDQLGQLSVCSNNFHIKLCIFQNALLL